MEIPGSTVFEEVWNVVILSGTKLNFFSLPPTTTMSEVRQRWESHIQKVGAFLIVGCDGSKLRDDLQIAEIGEVAPGSKTVNLVAEEATTVFLKMYGSSTTENTAVAVDPSMTSAEFHQLVADTLELPEVRIFRLLTDAGLLTELDQSLDEQGVGMKSVIQVDFGYNVDIIDEEEETIEYRVVFASDDVADLLDDEDGSKRLMIGRRTMTPTGDFHNALPPIYRKMTHCSLEVQTMQEVTSLVNNRFTQKHMWPSNIVDKCLPPTACGKKLKFEGKSISKRKSLKEINLPNHSLLCTTTRVTVMLSNGKRRLMKLPESSTISDLAAELHSIEGTDNFVLRCGNRVLEGEELVRKVGSDREEISVDRQMDFITVSLHDRCMRWQREKAVLRFSDLMNTIAKRGKLKVQTSSDLVLQCKGCGRRLTRARERHQTIPAKCCEVRSLDLQELWEPKMEGTGTQGRCEAGGRVHTKRVGDGSSRVGVAQQTRRKTAASSTQHPVAPPSLPAGVAQQTRRRSAASSTQHPAPIRFVIFNDRGVGEGGHWMTEGGLFGGKPTEGHDSHTQLPVGDRPTAGQIKEAAALHFAISPAEVKMRRIIGRRKGDGEFVFHVFDDRRRRDDQRGFVDAAGRWSGDDGVEKKKWVELPDAAPFTVSPHLRNIIAVLRR